MKPVFIKNKQTIKNLFKAKNELFIRQVTNWIHAL